MNPKATYLFITLLISLILACSNSSNQAEPGNTNVPAQTKQENSSAQNSQSVTDAADEKPVASQRIDLDLAGIKDMPKEADASNERLRAIFASVDRIVVSKNPVEKSPVFFTSSKKQDIDELQSALSIVPSDRWFHCMCVGTPLIELFRGRELVAKISVHHGVSIRTDLWSSDAKLEDPEKLLSWFDTRGIHGPRHEVEVAKTEEAKSIEERRRWVAAMPPALRPLWGGQEDEIVSSGRNPDLAAWRTSLAAAIPKRSERIRALLTWYGSGSDKWSVYPSYESMAEELLQDFSTDAILEAVRSKQLDADQLEGAARFFAGWNFEQKRPSDRALLPKDLKAELLRHALKSPDQDNRSRAYHAFGK